MDDMEKAIREAVEKAIREREYILMCNIEEVDSVKEATDRKIIVIGYQMIEKGKAYIMKLSDWAKTMCEEEIC